MRNLAKRDGRSASRSSAPVGDIMDSEVVTIEPNATASFAWSQMQSRRTQHLIVMEDGDCEEFSPSVISGATPNVQDAWFRIT